LCWLRAQAPRSWTLCSKGEERIDAEGAGPLILLRGHYFITGSLPKTDAECAKVCRLGARKFARIRSWLFSFFDNEGRSAELDASIEETERIISNRREAGHKGGVGKALNEELQEEEHAKSSSTKPSPPPSFEPRAREGDEIATEALAVLPISVRANPGWRGLGAWIARLLSDGVDRADIVGIAQCLRSLKGQPPNTFGYFSAAIERAREARTRPLSRAAPVPLPDQPHQLGPAGDCLKKMLGNEVFAAWFGRSKVVSVAGDNRDAKRRA
jgi:uncharacterized protein YdaU (DUF1376 family)